MLLLAAAGLVIGVLGYRLYHRGDHTLPDLAALPVPSVVSTVAIPSAATVATVDAVPAAVPAASATAADFPVVPAPAPAPVAATSVAPTASTPTPAAAEAVPGSVQVTLTTVPPKGQFFHFGKRVGISPYVVTLAPGEKHAYEVYLPGHITRKVLVDGSQPEITLGLREEPH